VFAFGNNGLEPVVGGTFAVTVEVETPWLGNCDTGVENPLTLVKTRPVGAPLVKFPVTARGAVAFKGIDAVFGAILARRWSIDSVVAEMFSISVCCSERRSEKDWKSVRISAVVASNLFESLTPSNTELENVRICQSDTEDVWQTSSTLTSVKPPPERVMKSPLERVMKGFE
jgi:hypothetical protein